MMRRTLRAIAAVGTRLFLALLVAWTLAPIALMVYTALSSTGIGLYGGVGNIGFDNFRRVLSDDTNDFSASLKYSLALSGIVTALSLSLGIPAAYALARSRSRTVQWAGDWIFSTRFLPPVVAAIPLFLLLGGLGLAGTLPGLALVDLLIALPFVVWVLRSYMADLPESIEEMATADGLSTPSKLLHVFVPNLLAPVGATAAMVWLLIWNEYLFALLFSGSTRPLTVLIASWNTYEGVQWGPACAAGVLAATPALLLLVVSLRILLRGFTFGWRGIRT